MDEDSILKWVHASNLESTRVADDGMCDWCSAESGCRVMRNGFYGTQKGLVDAAHLGNTDREIDWYVDIPYPRYHAIILCSNEKDFR